MNCVLWAAALPGGSGKDGVHVHLLRQSAFYSDDPEESIVYSVLLTSVIPVFPPVLMLLSVWTIRQSASLYPAKTIERNWDVPITKAAERTRHLPRINKIRYSSGRKRVQRTQAKTDIGILRRGPLSK